MTPHRPWSETSSILEDTNSMRSFVIQIVLLAESLSSLLYGWFEISFNILKSIPKMKPPITVHERQCDVSRQTQEFIVEVRQSYALVAGRKIINTTLRRTVLICLIDKIGWVLEMYSDSESTGDNILHKTYCYSSKKSRLQTDNQVVDYLFLRVRRRLS